jgi:hypothetical protein
MPWRSWLPEKHLSLMGRMRRRDDEEMTSG